MPLVPREDEFIKYVSEDLAVFIARSFTVQAPLLVPHKKLAIHADEVILRGIYAAQGAELYINCRTLTCDDVTVDVSGKPGANLSGLKPPPHDRNGGNGADDVAEPGGDAGVIVIVTEEITGKLKLVAAGGKGGRGMDGGDGLIGSEGARGLDASDHEHPAQPGFPGGAGGDAGKAGKPGVGGRGGRIDVYCVGPVGAGHLEFHVDGGRPGDRASHGKPGKGGRGGFGGHIKHCEWVPGTNDGLMATLSAPVDERHKIAVEAFIRFAAPVLDRPEAGRGPTPGYWRCEWIDAYERNGPEGPMGQSGDAKFGPPPSNVAGPNGVVTNSTITSEVVATFTNLAFLSILLNLAESQYRNMAVEPALRRLLSVSTYAAALLADGKRPTNAVWYEGEITAANKQELQGLLDRSRALLKQIGLGFEYYGRAPDYVPSLSIDFYKDYIERLFTQVQPIEDDYASYTAALGDQHKVEQFVLNALARNVILIDHRRADQQKAIAKQREIEPYLDIVSADLEGARQRVIEAANRFEAEIRAAAGGGCDIKQILVALGCIIGMAGAAKDAIKSLLDGFDVLERTIGQRLAGILNNLVQVRTFAQTTGTNIEKLRTDYTTFKHLLEQDPDAVKIVVADDVEKDLQNEQLNKILSQHADMPAAVNLRRQMSIFRGLVAAKNLALLDYAACAVEVFRLEAAIAQIEAESGRVQKQFTDIHDPTIPAVQAYMRKAYSDSKEFVARRLFDLNKAYEYWTCNTSPLRLDVGQLSQLRATYAALNDRVADALASIGPGQQKERSLTFSIADLAGADEIARFKKIGVANFSLDLDHLEFAPLYNVFVREIRLWAEGAKTANNLLTIIVIHSGVSQRIGLNGQQRVFHHDPQKLRFRYSLLDPTDIRSRAIFGGEAPKSFFACSPATSWRVVADGIVNLRPDFAAVTDIRLELDISYNVR